MKKIFSEIEYKKNDIIEVDILDISSQGEGIGKTGVFTWFIKDTVIGDRVLAKVMKTKKSYGYARLAEIISASKDRVEPECNVARSCGGCSLQNMSYDAELLFKENKVFNNLIRIGGFNKEDFSDSPKCKDSKIKFEKIIGMEHPVRYRNKAQFPVAYDKNGDIVSGFYAGRTHSIIPCEDCLIGIEENNIIRKIILDFMKENSISPYDEGTNKGIVRHILIRKGFTTGEIMVCLIINANKLPKADKLVESLKNIAAIKSISYNINKENTNVIMGKQTELLYGKTYISDYIGSIKFNISPTSFYQVNSSQTKILYEKALEYADINGNEIVWDLYCGIGTISLFLAQKAKKVYGIEIVEQAILDARNNAKINNIENVEFYVGKAEEVLPRLYEEAKESNNKEKLAMIKPDVIVVDPPRKGCDINCLDTMIRMQPSKIVYVSCDSATLARDIRYLVDGGYRLKKVQPVDQFAKSVHVETIALLQRR